MKIIIVGKGKGWDDAPLEGELWGITQLNLRRIVSLVIDMNDYRLWGPKEANEAAISKFNAKIQGIPYIDLETYPLKEVMEKFDTDYFSNTVDYAIALALYRGATEIDLYGVTMSVNSEYHYQKPGVDFWCGMAKGMGVKLNVYGKRSTIMKTKTGRMYGYEVRQPSIINRKESGEDEEDGLCCLRGGMEGRPLSAGDA